MKMIMCNPNLNIIWENFMPIQIHWALIQKAKQDRQNYKLVFENFCLLFQSLHCCDCVHYSTVCSLQVHHWPARAPGRDPPPRPGPHFGPHNCHYTDHLPLPSQADSNPASAPQRSLHVQEHVISGTRGGPAALSKANPIKTCLLAVPGLTPQRKVPCHGLTP